MRGHWIVAVVALAAALMWFAAAQSNSGQPRPTDDRSDASGARPATPVAGERATIPVAREPSHPERAASAESQAPQAATPSTTPAAPIEAVADPNPSGPRAPERSGPVDVLEAAFRSEPRASGAVRVESAIDAVFRRAEVPRDLLKSVMCRSTVCRVETRWSPARASGFMVALMQLVTQRQGEHAFDHELGIGPEGEPDADGSRAIAVYLKYSAR